MVAIKIRVDKEISKLKAATACMIIVGTTVNNFVYQMIQCQTVDESFLTQIITDNSPH